MHLHTYAFTYLCARTYIFRPQRDDEGGGRQLGRRQSAPLAKHYGSDWFAVAHHALFRV